MSHHPSWLYLIDVGYIIFEAYFGLYTEYYIDNNSVSFAEGESCKGVPGLYHENVCPTIVDRVLRYFIM